MVSLQGCNNSGVIEDNALKMFEMRACAFSDICVKWTASGVEPARVERGFRDVTPDLLHGVYPSSHGEKCLPEESPPARTKCVGDLST